MTTDDDTSFHVDFASGHRIDIEALRRRRSAFMPDNGHAWVISTVFALDDPEQALASMELGAETFIGVSGISCLLCQEVYRSSNRFHKCPQAPTGDASTSGLP